MQRERTIQFWDEFYSSSHQDQHEHTSSANTESVPHRKEWILQPTDALFEKICSYLPETVARQKEDPQNVEQVTNTETQSIKVEILEIGCGVSQLSKELYKYLTEKHPSSSMMQCHVIATDVSSVCIEQMILRDNDKIRSSKNRFSYQVLNVLDDVDSLTTSMGNNRYSMVLDKGCLDTFLFRSQQNLQWKLMTRLLDNIHSWLRNDGVYVILSPRSKIKFVRDHVGFSSVKHIPLHSNSEGSNRGEVVLGELDGMREATSAEGTTVHMYVCAKNSNYAPGACLTFPFRQMHDASLLNDDNACPTCGLAFSAFRGKKNGDIKQQERWRRRWNGHVIHCK